MNKDADDVIQAYVAAGGRAADAKAAWISDLEDRLVPSYNISPTDTVAVIRERLDTDTGEARREAELAVWDLRPPWRTQLGKPMINARLESLADRRMWRHAFARRRVLIPMIGYYEWSGPKSARIPHFLHSPGQELLSAAGLAEVRNVGSREEPAWEVSCAIITREARDASGEVHDRMPVFLPAVRWDSWLDARPVESADQPAVLAMLARESEAAAADLLSHPVDPRVNRAGAGVDDPATIEPVG